MLVTMGVIFMVGALVVWESSRRARWSGYVYLLDTRGMVPQQQRVKAVHLRTKDEPREFRRIETDLALYEGAYRLTGNGVIEGEGRFIFSPAPLTLDEILEIDGSNLTSFERSGSCIH